MPGVVDVEVLHVAREHVDLAVVERARGGRRAAAERLRERLDLPPASASQRRRQHRSAEWRRPGPSAPPPRSWDWDGRRLELLRVHLELFLLPLLQLLLPATGPPQPDHDLSTQYRAWAYVAETVTFRDEYVVNF